MRAAWLWLRIRVIYWRDDWPQITTHARRCDEVARALQGAAEMNALLTEVEKMGSRSPRLRQLRRERIGLHVLKGGAS